jgi:chorismate dehydratase
LNLDAGYCRRYFDTIIRYDLGEEELAGLKRFQHEAAELGLIPEGVRCEFYCADERDRPHPGQSR